MSSLVERAQIFQGTLGPLVNQLVLPRDDYLEFKIIMAMFVGARRSTHSAIVRRDSDLTASSFKSFSFDTISAVGMSRSIAWQHFSDSEARISNRLDFNLPKLDGKEREVLDFLILNFNFSSIAGFSDGDWQYLSQGTHSKGMLAFSRFQVHLGQTIVANYPDVLDGGRTLEMCRELGLQILFCDSKVASGQDGYIALPDIFLKKAYQWSSRAVEKQLRWLLSNGGAPALNHAEREQLSINAGTMFYRSLREDKSKTGTPPLIQLEHLLSLFELGTKMLQKLPEIMEHQRSAYYVAADSGTLELDWIMWCSRARLRTNELANMLGEEDWSLYDLRWRMFRFREKLFEIVLVASWKDLECMADSLLSDAALNSSELSVIALWAAHRSHLGIPRLATENVRRRFLGCKAGEVVVPQLQKRHLELLLAAFKIGSFVYASLPAQVTILERDIQEISLLDPMMSHFAQEMVSAALQELE
ncbi:hypothetical protein T439DRAFT_329405 [Meredithblackwellia eburnea MCA 4105]